MARTAQVHGTALMGTMMVAMAMMVAASDAGADEMVILERGAYGPYGVQTLVVANSAGSWRQAMADLEAADALVVHPGPDAPANVDWSHEVVVLVAAGASGYDVTLMASRTSNGRTKVDAEWLRMEGADGGESLPYVLVKLPKTAYLWDQVTMGSDVMSALPLVGDAPVPATPASWGQLKAAYR